MAAKKPPAHGGMRVGAGRKAETGDGGALMRKTITVDATTVAILTGYGGGELSEGVRRAARIIQQIKQQT